MLRRYTAIGVSLAFFAGVWIAFYFIAGAIKDFVSESIIWMLGFLACGVVFFGGKAIEDHINPPAPRSFDLPEEDHSDEGD